MNDFDGIFRQSGVIPIHREGKMIEVLLITSRGRKRWIIPKGIVEPYLSPAESAAKEAYEEAGIRGTVSTPALGSYRYSKWGGTCHVEVFLMNITGLIENWPEADFRERRFFSIREAAGLVNEKDLKNMILRVDKA
ncbi:MAG: NUDIX hydrolase [Verrucomicrobia bacterium]|nr:NUDIX hydrolase [Verrucomicrobiota bacterium]